MVCLGEGEEAMLTLLNRMYSGEGYSTTPNIWLKQNNYLIKNDVQNLTQNLDNYLFQCMMKNGNTSAHTAISSK